MARVHFPPWPIPPDGENIGAVEQIKAIPPERLHERDLWGGTWLHRAAYCCHAEAIDALVARGLDVHARDYAGMTPLFYACCHGRTEMGLTVDGPCDVLGEEGEAPIRAAERLIAAGANVNARECGLRTPLMFAAAGLRYELVGWLLGAGADHTLTDDRGLGPVDHAYWAYGTYPLTIENRPLKLEAERIQRLLEG